jgi:hypothetical protein
MVILAVIVVAQLFMGHRKAFLIKKGIEFYMAATPEEK